MKEMLRTRVGERFRRMALPLAAYYAVTLVLPFANGAAQAGAAFAKHALVVVVVPPVGIVLACVAYTISRHLLNLSRRTRPERPTWFRSGADRDRSIDWHSG